MSRKYTPCYAVLLVPEKGDPHELLTYGPCGSRPPMAVRRTYPRVVHESNKWGDPTYNGEKCVACDQPWPCDTPSKVESKGHVRWQPGNRHTTVADALVLAWGGKSVPEGMDRAARRWEAATESNDRSLQEYDLWWTQKVHAIDLGSECQRFGIGTVVLLDATGKEIA